MYVVCKLHRSTLSKTYTKRPKVKRQMRVGVELGQACFGALELGWLGEVSFM